MLVELTEKEFEILKKFNLGESTITEDTEDSEDLEIMHDDIARASKVPGRKLMQKTWRAIRDTEDEEDRHQPSLKDKIAAARSFNGTTEVSNDVFNDLDVTLRELGYEYGTDRTLGDDAHLRDFHYLWNKEDRKYWTRIYVHFVKDSNRCHCEVSVTTRQGEQHIGKNIETDNGVELANQLNDIALSLQK